MIPTTGKGIVNKFLNIRRYEAISWRSLGLVNRINNQTAEVYEKDISRDGHKKEKWLSNSPA